MLLHSQVQVYCFSALLSFWPTLPGGQCWAELPCFLTPVGDSVGEDLLSEWQSHCQFVLWCGLAWLCVGLMPVLRAEAGRVTADFVTSGCSGRPDSYLVDPASSHMLVSKTKPCMSKYKRFYTVKLRMAH